ncbi:unnamed protein product [Linum tenue]|uniref:S-protein homolog n=1 Tax=Linum tenue TaxID=586396 RepID=A0AAV0IG99_9ROSI|nr:unnamed protein product [Linum tenue]
MPQSKQQQPVITTITIIATIVIMAARRPLVSDARIVNITNRVGGMKALLVHCASADDDLGARAVNSGEVYSWHFEDNWQVLRNALFWCNLALEDERVSFQAYVERAGRGGYAVLGYDVNETGVFGPDMNDMSRTETQTSIP